MTPPLSDADSLAAVLADLAAGRLDAEQVQRLQAALASCAPRWTSKTAAARELGVSVECVRGRCNRSSSPVPTTFRSGRELVDVEALRRDLFDSSPRTNANQRIRPESDDAQVPQAS